MSALFLKVVHTQSVEGDENPKPTKFAAVLNIMSRCGEFVLGEITSAFVWDSPVDALEAGLRAEVVAIETGKLPNMCEVW